MEMFDGNEIMLLLDKLYRTYHTERREDGSEPTKEEFTYYVLESLTPPRVPGRLREVVERWTKEA